MKITISLKRKITIIFAFLFILLILALLPFQKMEERKEIEKVARDYENLLQPLEEQRLPKKEVIVYLLKYNFKQVENPKEIFQSLKEPPLRKKFFEILRIENHYYLHIVTPHFRVLFLDNVHTYERSRVDLIIFFFLLTFFGIIYYLIIKNINDGEHQLKSRQLFLRTIMHELKTPIAKGRIIGELIEDEKQKNRIITIFEKLNFLIDDFAKVEQVVSCNYKPIFFPHNINDIINKSIELLLLEQTNNIKLEGISKKQLNVDFDLFPMALKNLIDNGLKYSLDKQIIIKEENNTLLFISKGAKLPKPLEEYFQPFHSETKDKNHGMGLGLYIVESILKMHNLKLQYKHRENQNIFSILYSDLF